MKDKSSEVDHKAVDRAVIDVFAKEIEYYRLVSKASVPFTTSNQLSPLTIFKYVDEDDRGYLDFHNLEAFLKKMHKTLTDEDYDALLRRIDKSHSRKICLQDFREVLFPIEVEKLSVGHSKEAFSRDVSPLYSVDGGRDKPSLSQTKYNPNSPPTNTEARRQASSAKKVQQPRNYTGARAIDWKGLESYRIAGTNVLDNFLRPQTEINDDLYEGSKVNANDVSEGSHLVYLPKSSLDGTHTHSYEQSDRQEPYGKPNPVFYSPDYRNSPLYNVHSKDTLNLPANPSPGDINSCDLDGEVNWTFPRNLSQKDYFAEHHPIPAHPQGRLSEHYTPMHGVNDMERQPPVDRHSPVKDLNSTGYGHIKEVRNSPSQHAQSHGILPGHSQRTRSMQAHRETPGTQRNSPLLYREADPLFNTYWNYSKKHNNTVTASHPFTATSFPYNMTKNTNDPMAGTMKSRFLSHYQPILHEKIDVRRFKENPFRHSDHEHYFKNFYNNLRGGYYEHYFNTPSTEVDQATFQYNREVAESRQSPHTRTKQGFRYNEPKHVSYKDLHENNGYRADEGYWPGQEALNGPSYQLLSNLVRDKAEDQKPLEVEENKGETYHNYQQPARHNFTSTENLAAPSKHNERDRLYQGKPQKSVLREGKDLRNKYGAIDQPLHQDSPTQLNTVAQMAQIQPFSGEKHGKPADDKPKNYSFSNSQYQDIWRRSGPRNHQDDDS